MRRLSLVCISCLAIAACNHSDTVLHSTSDGGQGSGSGTCSVPPWTYGSNEPSWVTNSCPSGGCPGGTTCVHGQIAAAILELGCAPIPSACGGTPDCSCMGCMCGGISTCGAQGSGLELLCETPTDSSRTVKADIAYVDADERAALARQALAIPLARYRYKREPAGARRRLGFIIEDQPDPSPAVLADRAHVDQYGYTSMLLATVQQQAQELAELRARVARLERASPSSTR